MSGHGGSHAPAAQAPGAAWTGGARLAPADILARLVAACPEAAADPAARDLAAVVPAGRLVEAVRFLRDEPALAFDCLLDVVALDCSGLPGAPARFAASYALRSTRHLHRLRLKAYAAGGEEAPVLPTLSGLFPVADWLEREAWDMMGIRFAGHPNLKRLLTHREFVGHPLRRDYPVDRRQPLSSDDSMLDELSSRLQGRGWRVLGPDEPEVAP